MSLDALAQYLQEIEAAIGKLDQAYVERYEEEHLTSERLNLRIWGLLRRQDNQDRMVEVHIGQARRINFKRLQLNLVTARI
jgi:hypothetical protein